METIKLKFGIHKGKMLKDIPDDYLKYLYSKNILKGKIKLYVQRKFNMPKSKFRVQVEDSANNSDGIYYVEAYNSNEAIRLCQRINNIQNTQSFHGTSYSTCLVE